MENTMKRSLLVLMILLTAAFIFSSNVCLADDNIRKIQLKLFLLGYDPGVTDGLMGKKTRTAIKDFQQSKNMLANGELNEDTLKVLDIEEDTYDEILNSDTSGRTEIFKGPLSANPNIASSGGIPFLTTSNGVVISMHGHDFNISESLAKKLGLLVYKSETSFVNGQMYIVSNTEMPEVRIKAVIGKIGDKRRILKIERY